MTLPNHINQKYNRHFEKLSQNCPNKSTRNCIQQDPVQVNFIELPRYTNSAQTVASTSYLFDQ